MNVKFSHVDHSLQSKTIFLAASVGDEANENNDIEVEEAQEALISLSRAVYTRSGRFAFVHKPPLFPLFLTVAAEYVSVTRAREERVPPPIEIYTISKYEFSEEDQLFSDAGYVKWNVSATDNREALAIMLENANPFAMVCVGGAGEVAEQAGAFRETRIGRTRPIYVLERTGGDATRIRERIGAESIDRLIIEEIERLRPEVRLQEEREPSREGGLTTIAYPLVMQLLVEKLEG
jgi:hypothetical protein